MKKRIVHVLSCLLLMLQTNGIFAQQNPILGSFSLTENNGSVNINWSIFSGNTCDGTRIFRSADGVSFYQIGEIVGICGSATVEESYSFTDDAPLKNRLNYYRLELGLSGYTHTLSIEIIEIDEKGFLVWPNPISTEGKIYFNNAKAQKHSLDVYNSDGKIVFSSETNNRFFQINNSVLISGNYLFSIKGQEKIVSGKFVVLK